MKKPSRRRAGLTHDAWTVALEEVLTVLIGQSDVAATLATLEARFRLLAQDPPRGVRGADITRIAEPLLAVFRDPFGEAGRCTRRRDR